MACAAMFLVCVLAVSAVTTTAEKSGPFYIQSHNFPSRHFTFGFSSKSLHLDEGGKRFLLHSPGLTGEQGTVTFESMDKKGHYLRHINNYLEIDPEDGRNPDSLAADATFRLHTDQWFKGYESYESINSPEHFICHYNNLVRLARNSTSGAFETDASFRRQRGKREQKICDES